MIFRHYTRGRGVQLFHVENIRGQKHLPKIKSARNEKRRRTRAGNLYGESWNYLEVATQRREVISIVVCYIPNWILRLQPDNAGLAIYTHKSNVMPVFSNNVWFICSERPCRWVTLYPIIYIHPLIRRKKERSGITATGKFIDERDAIIHHRWWHSQNLHKSPLRG